MTQVLDDHAIERAFRAAERALAAGDPDTLAGRFAPKPPPAPAVEASQKRKAAQG